ncbi:MAG: hypothetical protein RLY30_151 [Pseudomonadota bacterium]|jgi:salicylate hydroxylase
MTTHASRPIIIGAGVAGLAAGIALAQKGTDTLTLDKATEAKPAGGGIQLGPNAVRVLYALGLRDELHEHAAQPDRLEVRQLSSGRQIGQLTLGQAMARRYGAPYCTVLRADLTQTLLRRHAELGLDIRWGQAIASVQQTPEQVSVRTDGGLIAEGPVVLGADGLWSVTRRALAHANQPQPAGQIAVRAVLPADRADGTLARTIQVHTAPGRHLVTYPIQSGQAIAIVAIVPHREHLSPGWGAPLADHLLLEALEPIAPQLRATLQAASPWLAWPLWAATPLTSPWAHATGRIALLGDAAHPMRPHLAQGAAMGLEDALVLANAWAARGAGQPSEALRSFAELRWRRNANTQIRALRVGKVFQLSGPAAWARNLALGLLSETLMDQREIYAYDAQHVGTV